MKHDRQKTGSDFLTGVGKCFNATIAGATIAAFALGGTCISTPNAGAATRDPSTRALSRLDQQTVDDIASMTRWHSESKGKADMEPAQAGFM